MAKKHLVLEGFTKGQFMSWIFTSQAANLIRVKLYDETGHVYFQGEKRSTDINPPLSQANSYIYGNQVQLDLESVNSEVLDTWFNNSMIMSATSGKSVGRTFVLAGEDQKGGDDDYNDVYASIVAWNSKG